MSALHGEAPAAAHANIDDQREHRCPGLLSRREEAFLFEGSE
jgi:hypothetical protein